MTPGTFIKSSSPFRRLNIQTFYFTDDSSLIQFRNTKPLSPIPTYTFTDVILLNPSFSLTIQSTLYVFGLTLLILPSSLCLSRDSPETPFLKVLHHRSTDFLSLTYTEDLRTEPLNTRECGSIPLSYTSCVYPHPVLIKKKPSELQLYRQLLCSLCRPSNTFISKLQFLSLSRLNSYIYILSNDNGIHIIVIPLITLESFSQN